MEVIDTKSGYSIEINKRRIYKNILSPT